MINKLLLFIVVLSVAFVFLQPGKSYAENTIIWFVNDWPPAQILRGPNKGTGYFDRLERLFEANLQTYSHEYIKANAKRMNEELAMKKNVCVVDDLYNNPHRKSIAIYTLPTLVVFPHFLIVSTKQRHRFGNTELVSLEKLLQNKNLTLGIAIKRPYGPILDPIIEKHKGAKNIYVRSGKNIAQGFFYMISKNRLDYFIEYSFVYKYEMSMPNRSKEDFSLIPIAEHQGVILTGGIACPNSKWGRKTVADLNRMLLKIRKTTEYYKILEEWLVPKGKEKEYRKAFEDKVLSVVD